MTQSLETVARAFLAQADTREFSPEQAEAFFREREVLVNFFLINALATMEGIERAVYRPLMVVHRLGSEGLAVPPILVGMLGLNTGKYFDGHDGLAPIRGSDITKFPVLRRGLDNSWSVVERGIVDRQ